MVALLGLPGCGHTSTAEPAEMTGEAGATGSAEPEPEPEPKPPCDGEYEGLPPQTPARMLPTLLETELCNARDSRVWAIEVEAERAVSVTLENPSTIDGFDLSVYRSDVDGYEPLPVTAGPTRFRLGSLAERTFSFTPASSGNVSLYAGLGISRDEPIRLQVTQ
jgi:hypothetical protein